MCRIHPVETSTSLKTRFKAEGLKLTPQRLAVFDALEGNKSHPTAETIWDEVKKNQPNISLRTIYQVLNDLVQMGEVNSFDYNGTVRFDTNSHNHDHFICTLCKKIFDVHIKGKVELNNESNFKVDTTEVIFKGKCTKCSQASTN